MEGLRWEVERSTNGSSLDADAADQSIEILQSYWSLRSYLMVGPAQVDEDEIPTCFLAVSE